MIRLSNIYKTFSSNGSSVQVLKGISFELAPGETAAVCGPSGVGKSTLLHIAGLMDTASSGSLELFDKKTDGLAPDARAELRSRNIGFFFQFHYLAADFTVAENIQMPAWISRGYGQKNAEFGELVENLGLSKLLDRFPNELSGGEQQRVALARALINGPKLILADEPTGNLDKHNGEVVSEMLFNEAKKKKASVMIATHNPELAAKADRIIQLLDGRLAN